MKKILATTFIFSASISPIMATASTTPKKINAARILQNAPKLNPQALQYAIKGYYWAQSHHKVGNSNVLTVIDFNLPSYDKRVWVIDLNTDKVAMRAYTTQGKGSGLVYARRFTNKRHTDETSLGVYETLNTYTGKHGTSMRLQGLEAGINDNAFRRTVVVHPAWYSTPQFVKQYHRTGRSWGCFGINPAKSQKFIDLTKDGSVIFAYADQERDDPNLA